MFFLQKFNQCKIYRKVFYLLASFIAASNEHLRGFTKQNKIALPLSLTLFLPALFGFSTSTNQMALLSKETLEQIEVQEDASNNLGTPSTESSLPYHDQQSVDQALTSNTNLLADILNLITKIYTSIFSINNENTTNLNQVENESTINEQTETLVIALYNWVSALSFVSEEGIDESDRTYFNIETLETIEDIFNEASKEYRDLKEQNENVPLTDIFSLYFKYADKLLNRMETPETEPIESVDRFLKQQSDQAENM